MKTLKIEKLAIALIIVYGLIFLIVITAMAWFSSSGSAETTPTEAGSISSVSLEAFHFDVSSDSYMGQTGIYVDKGAMDYMFSSDFKVTLQFSSSTDGYLTCSMDTISIDTTVGDKVTSTELTDTEIRNNFTWRLYDEKYEDCNYCAAKGFVLCSNDCGVLCSVCSGNGYINCSTCSGTGTANDGLCSTCYGNGKLSCSNCYGTGAYGIVCQTCNGNGTLTCDCHGEDPECPTCGGAGSISCSICHGLGIYNAECPECHGTNPDCTACQGNGLFIHVCQVCKGSGVNNSVACATCNATGVCPICRGAGKLPCVYCGGGKRLRSVSEFVNENNYMRETTKTTYNNEDQIVEKINVNKLKKTSDYSSGQMTLTLRIFFLGESGFSQIEERQKGSYSSSDTIDAKYTFAFSDEKYMYSVFNITMFYNIDDLFSIILNKGSEGELADVRNRANSASVSFVNTSGGENLALPTGEHMEATFTRVNLDSSAFKNENEIFYTRELLPITQEILDAGPVSTINYYREISGGASYKEVKLGSFSQTKPTHIGSFIPAYVYDSSKTYYVCDFDNTAIIKSGTIQEINKYLAGWNLPDGTFVNGNTGNYFKDDMLRNNITATADIREKIYVVYDLNYEGGNDEYYTIYVIPDYTVNFALNFEGQVAPTNPIRPGYRFIGWSDTQGASYSLLTNSWSGGFEYSYDEPIRLTQVQNGVKKLYAVWAPVRSIEVYLNDYWGGNSLNSASYLIKASDALISGDNKVVDCAIDSLPDIVDEIPVGQGLSAYLSARFTATKYTVNNGTIDNASAEDISSAYWLLKVNDVLRKIDVELTVEFDAETPLVIYAVWERTPSAKTFSNANEVVKFKYTYNVEEQVPIGTDEITHQPIYETQTVPKTTNWNTATIPSTFSLTVNKAFYIDGYLGIPYEIIFTDSNEEMIGFCTTCFGSGIYNGTTCSTCGGDAINDSANVLSGANNSSFILQLPAGLTMQQLFADGIFTLTWTKGSVTVQKTSGDSNSTTTRNNNFKNVISNYTAFLSTTAQATINIADVISYGTDSNPDNGAIKTAINNYIASGKVTYSNIVASSGDETIYLWWSSN